MKKLCIITGSRAEWGLFYPLAKEIKKNKSLFTLQIIATGPHLMPDFGSTYREILKDGFKINSKVKMLTKGDTDKAILRAISLGITGISNVLRKLKPDLVFLLGDRFETFSAATACLFLKIPIAHISGGEITEGSLDDFLRHAITKMSYLHFASTDVYRKRIIQMGEEPWRVFKVGALGLDSIKYTKFFNKKTLEKKLRFNFAKRNILVNFNSPTMEKKDIVKKLLMNLLKAVDSLKDIKIIFTKSNPDIYSEIINRVIENYVSRNKHKAIIFDSLGRELYLSSLRFMDLVVGNSSSGIVEVPLFKIATINIGNRQKGRLKALSVIDCDGSEKAIRNAIQKACSKEFRKRLKKVINPYGNGTSAKQIVKIIKDTNFSIPKKKFFDLPANLKKL